MSNAAIRQAVRFSSSLSGLVLLVVFWAAAAAALANPVLLPSPWEVAEVLGEVAISGGFYRDLGASMRRVLGGYILAGSAAVPLALAMASALSLEQAVALIHRHGGLAVAAHIDRPSFGVIGQLGFFPHEAGFDAVELSRHVAAGSPDEAGYRSLGLPVLRSSDAHFPADIATARTALALGDTSFAELALALRGANGRSVTDA